MAPIALEKFVAARHALYPHLMRQVAAEKIPCRPYTPIRWRWDDPQRLMTPEGLHWDAQQVFEWRAHHEGLQLAPFCFRRVARLRLDYVVNQIAPTMCWHKGWMDWSRRWVVRDWYVRWDELGSGKQSLLGLSDDLRGCPDTTGKTHPDNLIRHYSSSRTGAYLRIPRGCAARAAACACSSARTFFLKDYILASRLALASLDLFDGWTTSPVVVEQRV